MPLYSYNRQHKSYARALRREQTNAESLLWLKLRSRRLEGFKFRRQHPIDHYIIDFYCEKKKLAIELDGSQHNDNSQKDYDLKRTARLNELGINVIRFWDNEVLKNLDNVLETISRNLLI